MDIEGIVLSQICQRKKLPYAFVTEQTRGGVGGRGTEKIKKIPPFFSGGSSPVLGLLCPPPEERHLSMPEIDKKERNYYLK